MRWKALANLIRAHDLRVGAEVGTRDGKNIQNVLRLCPDVELIHAIDWDHSGYRGPRYRVEFHEGTSWKVAQDFPDAYFDWVFIDAGHDQESVSRDIEAYRPKMKPGGWVTGHDYGNDRFPGVAKGVHQHFRRVTVERPIANRSGVWLIQV